MSIRDKRNLGEVVNSFIYGCSNGTETGCVTQDPLMPEGEDVLEKEFAYGLRLWHFIFLSAGAVMGVIILICCCIKFRIPRTKQEIEGDYIRRKILKKFRARLKAIQNQELDEMDLKRALDKIRAEFKSDSESLAQSEALSVATISSSGFGNPHSSTYRRASQIAMDISIEDLRAQTLGCRGRMSYALSRCCGRSRRAKISQSEPKLIPKDTTVKPGKEEKRVEVPGSSKGAQKQSKPTVQVAVIDETSKKKKGKAQQQPTVHIKGEKKPEKVPVGAGGALDKKSDKGDNKDDKKKNKEKEKAGKKVEEMSEQPKQIKDGKEAKQGKDKSKEDKEKVKQEIKEKKEKEKEEKLKREREKSEREKIEKEKKQKEKAEKERAKIEKQKQEKEAKKDKGKK